MKIFVNCCILLDKLITVLDTIKMNIVKLRAILLDYV